MTAYKVRLQPCGCISLPEELVALLRIGPGAEFRVHAEAAQRSLRLEVVSQPTDGAAAVERAACSIDPPV